MLNNKNCRSGFLLNLINQLNCSPACYRIQVCKRFIKQKNLHIIHHNAGKTDPLLLSSGQFIWCMIQMMLNIHKLCHSLHRFLHIVLRHTVILKCKSNILCHGQSDKLSVRIL